MTRGRPAAGGQDTFAGAGCGHLRQVPELTSARRGPS
jgi:hypothetical protein